MLFCFGLYLLFDHLEYESVANATLWIACYMLLLSVIGDITEQIALSIEVGSKRGKTRAQLAVLKEIQEKL